MNDDILWRVPAVPVNDRRQIKLAFIGPQRRDVADPLLARLGGREILLPSVRGNRQGVFRVRRRLELLAGLRSKTLPVEARRDRLAVGGRTRVYQFRRETWRTVTSCEKKGLLHALIECLADCRPD